METAPINKLAVALGIVLAVLVASGSAAAQEVEAEAEVSVGGGGSGGGGRAGARDIRVDLHGDFGWYGAVGAGFRVDITIIPEGLIEGIEDDLSISPGADLMIFYSNYYGSGGVGIWPLFAFQWNFFLSERWTIFPELGVVFFFAQESQYRERYWKSIVAPFGGFGARWWFSSSNALLMRVSWPAGLQVGIIF